MNTIDDLFGWMARAALVVVLLSQLLAGCGATESSTIGLAVPRLPSVDLASFVVVPPAEELEPAVPSRDPRANWCEPLDQQFCRDTRECSDGARCVTPWWAATGTTTKVCARTMPTRAEKRWRADRLRVYVDYVCRRSGGCEPNDLHAYLRVMALRESTWRPWKRHRLGEDLDAAHEAWQRNREKYSNNQAAGDTDRWGSGVGYLGQLPADWLLHWDPMAPPETLCGEVECVEVHLRRGRVAVGVIARGVECKGSEFTGSACVDGRCQPSWYDVSRLNSGTLCPGSSEHQEAFAARARRVGLDPWAPVSAADLGQSIPRERQDEIAAELRAEMDKIPRP